MKAILIIAHHCILPGAYKGFEEILDRLHHDLPGTRVASTSLLDLENDLRTLLREDVESVTLLPCLGDWKEFSSMVVCGIRNAQSNKKAPAESLVSRSSSNSNLFSIELNLEGRNVLVVGGGRIALRKVKTLIPTGAHITVVAPQFDPEFHALCRHSERSEESSCFSNSATVEPTSITLKQRPYEPLDLRCVFMVFICTDQPAVNAQVSNDARARRILVNNACDYLDGDFIVPARMDFGENIAVTVSTQGRAPSLAKKLKQKIQTEWAEDLVQIEKDFKKE